MGCKGRSLECWRGLAHHQLARVYEGASRVPQPVLKWSPVQKHFGEFWFILNTGARTNNEFCLF